VARVFWGARRDGGARRGAPSAPTGEPPEATLAYRALLASLPPCSAAPRPARVGAVRRARLRELLAFWSTLAFHLEAPPLRWGSAAGGAFGLAGVVGALAASFVGRRNDRGDPRKTLGVGLLGVAGAWAVLGAFGAGVPGLVAGVILLDLGVQAAHVSNQARIFALDEAARGRINAVYMVGYFAGGAAGSAAAAAAWARAGWGGVVATGAACVAVALLVYARGRRAASGTRRANATLTRA
jgi:MFS family permease